MYIQSHAGDRLNQTLYCTERGRVRSKVILSEMSSGTPRLQKTGLKLKSQGGSQDLCCKLRMHVLELASSITDACAMDDMSEYMRGAR